MLPYFTTAPMHAQLREQLLAFWPQFYDTNWYVLGDYVAQFEKEYAAFNQTTHCIGVANGLDALFIALKSLGISEGDEVIVPSNTYIASWLAVTMTGARPIPVEPNPLTWNIDPSGISAAITDRTKAILPVHLYGQACEMGPIMALAQQHGLWVVEDNAQAHGATWEGQLTGSFGQINGVSFYPTKNLGALGDAGAITTNDAQLADFVRTYRNYGSKQKYYNEMAGINSRLDAAQAGILSLKLPFLDGWNQQRAVLAQHYLHQLHGHPMLQLPQIAPGSTSVWHLLVVLHPERERLMAHLATRQIQTMIHYPIPPYLQVAYGGLGYTAGDFPIAEKIAAQCVSLPLFPGMSLEQVDQVVEDLWDFY
jgi:dTDP-4-amino-4,6-dideoxygalactose transaminase